MIMIPIQTDPDPILNWCITLNLSIIWFNGVFDVSCLKDQLMTCYGLKYVYIYIYIYIYINANGFLTMMQNNLNAVEG